MPVITPERTLRAFLACLLLSLSMVSVCAQQPSSSSTANISPEKQALIRELLELVDSKKTLDAMFKAQAEQMDKDMPEVIWQAVSGMKEIKSLSPAQREELRLKVVSSSIRSGRRMYELLQEKVDFNKLIEDISLPLYDKYFTEGELRDIVVFNKSPTGRKVIQAMPILVTESMKRTADTVVPRVIEIMAQMQQEETERIEKEIQATVKIKEEPAKPARRTPQRRPKH